MEPVLSTIALNILGNLATDLVKWGTKQKVQAVQDAINSTADAFQALEGVSATLSDWLMNPRVSEGLSNFVQGRVGPAEIPIQELASVLINQTQFYLPGHAAPVAEKIILTFISKLRAAYLADPQTSGLYIANRQEIQFGVMHQRLENIQSAIESVSRPSNTSFGRRFESAVTELETGNVLLARSMLQSLLEDVRSGPLRVNGLERSVHAKLGTAFSMLGENTQAAYHLKAAAELEQEDPVRGTVNAAAAEMLEQRYDAAYKRLENLALNEGNDNFNYWHSKTMALLGLERFEEALQISQMPNIGGTAEKRHNLIGTVYLQSGQYDKAAKAYETACENNSKSPESHFGAGEMILFPLVTLHNEDPLASDHTAEFATKLQKAAEHFKMAADLFRVQGRVAAVAQAEGKLALAYCLQEKFIEVIHLLEPLVRDTAEGRQNLVNLGLAYGRCREAAKAADAFERALAIKSDPNTERIYIHALINSRQTKRALEFLFPRTNAPVTTETLPAHLALAAVRIARREYASAKQLLDALASIYPDNPEVLLTIAELNESTSNFLAASSAYQSALKNAVGRIETRVRVEFGYFSFRQKDFLQAVSIWKPLMRLGGNLQLRDPYLIALFNSRDYEEVIRISEEIRVAGGNVSPAVADVASAANEHLSNMQMARYWLEYLCDHYGNSPEYVMRLAQTELRLGHRNKAVELLDATKAALKDPSDLLGFAKGYSLLDKPAESLDLAFKAAQLEKSAEIYSGYIGAFLSATQNGQIQPTAEQIAFYQDAIGNFSNYFPGAKQIQSFQINPDDPLEGIREVLTIRSEGVERALEMFKKQRIPLTVLAKVLGRDMYEVWLQGLGHPELYLFCAVGSEDEAVQFQQSLITASGLILDVVALFTFTYLGLLERLKDFGDVYVAQAVLDYLHYMQSGRKMGTPAGTIGMIKGQFFMTEISPADVEKANAQLDRATGWVEQSVEIVGFRKALTQEEEEWIEPLGEATVATLTIAKQRSVLLLSDDKALRDIAKQTHGISGVTTQAVLMYLLNKGTISKSEYDGAVFKLVEAGYTFVRVEEDQFFALLDTEDFTITPPITTLFRVLESPALDLKSGCVVVAGLLRRLYSEIIPIDVKETLTLFVLNCLVKNHSEQKENIRLDVTALLQQQISPQAPLRLRYVFDVLRNW